MTLQETTVNQELAGVDLSQCAAIQQKRTLAFVNHFVVTTVKFLNNFMKKCEDRLMQFEYKLEKVEAAMVLLEARLSSIPEVNTESETKPQESTEGSTQSTDQTDKPITESDNTENVNTEDKQAETAEPINPEYERFVKMVQVGVPLAAVKLKASIEGLDPNILDKIIGNK